MSASLPGWQLCGVGTYSPLQQWAGEAPHLSACRRQAPESKQGPHLRQSAVASGQGHEAAAGVQRNRRGQPAR